MLTVLQVAYPLAPVGPDAVGGAEQVVARLDEAVVARGHRSIVIGCAGSEARGLVAATPAPPGLLDEQAMAAAQAAHRAAIARVRAETRVDVLHLHGIDFDRYLPTDAPPTVVTLHLPLDWYPPGALAPRPGVRFVCVSEAQRRGAPFDAEVIENGVPLGRWAARRRKRPFALTLGRLCPEKGFHLAIEAARQAGVPLVIGGRLFPYPAHVAYWEREVAPLLGPRAAFAGAVGGVRKQRLLAAARCLVVASTAPETSSLVAMEALAAGTPVVALRRGALPEIVDEGVTGFLADDVAGLADGITRAGSLDPADCRRAAERRFSAETMIERYLARYAALARPEAAA